MPTIDAPMAMPASTPLAVSLSMPTKSLRDIAVDKLRGIPIETPIDIDVLTPLDGPSTLDASKLLPPPEQFFASFDRMMTSLRQHAISQGYSITTKSSTRGGRCYYLQCDRGGTYRDQTDAPEGAKRRKTSTRRIGCPFLLYASKRHKTGQWKLCVKTPGHNHDPDDHMVAHPTARQLSDDLRQIIRNLSEVGTSPRQIIGVLKKQYPDMLVVPRDIYNTRAADRRAMLGNDTPLEHLLKKLSQDNWKHAFRQDNTGYIQFFMFAHPEAIRYAETYNKVFVLDCTYRTNRYKMPLLHIVGISPSNTSFSVAFCLMQNEQEESYIWCLETFFSWLRPTPHFHPVLCTDRDLALLNAIKAICPTYDHLLCIWHVNKNVGAYAKQYFIGQKQEAYDRFDQSWKSVINASNYDEYQAELAKFELSAPPPLVRYVKDTWFPYKHMFIRAYTGHVMHLGNAATSRAEGAHAFLKKHIGGRAGDMLSIFYSVSSAVLSQIDHIRSNERADDIYTLLFSKKPLYRLIEKHISRYSLTLINKQHQIAGRATTEAPLSICTGAFTRVYGLPCAHRIDALIKQNQPIPLTDIHLFWRIGGLEKQAYIPLLEPRPPAPPPKVSDRKDIVLVVPKKQKAPGRCSQCGEYGHNVRKCGMYSGVS